MGGLVWLASYPRSGNTWARVFLHNLLNMVEGLEPQDLDELDEMSTWDIADKWYRPFLNKAPNEASKEEVAALRPKVQQQIAASVDDLVFVKTHSALVMDRGTPTIDLSKTAGAVYIIRNPLDVVLSYAKHMNLTVETTVKVLNTARFETPNGPHAVYEFYGSWSQHVTSWTRRPHQAVHVMRYEDMIAEPVANFSRLARHLRIVATDKQLEKAVDLSSFKRLAKKEGQKGFREKPEQSQKFFRKGEVGQWRHELPAHLQEKIISAHGETMKKFDYLP